MFPFRHKQSNEGVAPDAPNPASVTDSTANTNFPE